MGKPRDWPFAEWLDVAVRIFGLSPQEFWAVSLSDWLTLLEQRTRGATQRPITRDDFSKMMMNFPDGTE